MPDDRHSERVELAIAGDLPLTDLTDGERAEVNARLDSNIQAAVAAFHFVPEAETGSVATFSLDEHGRLIEYDSDGSTSIID